MPSDNITITHAEAGDVMMRVRSDNDAVTLLTGGADHPYAFGLANALISKGVRLDIIGNDELDGPAFRDTPGVSFFNLRGDQRPNASFLKKASRVLMYYMRLIRYSAVAKPRVFHILWNNKFETFDRTLLMLYYRWLGKKVALTVHNVNARRRDANDTALNRLTLKLQYRLADHIFVHTDKMKSELIEEFDVREHVSVIPFGINNAVPRTNLSSTEAKRRLGLRQDERAILFFGNIAPYKGLEFAIAAVRKLSTAHGNYRLIIAGRPKNCPTYWASIREDIRKDVDAGRILLRADFIPDDETEVYFKASDVLVLPYRLIYQSGVLFLGQSFGLPVIASDVGSLKDDIVDGITGYVFKPEDSDSLASVLDRYFTSDLYASLDRRRAEIEEFANSRHSWDVVGDITLRVYAELLRYRQAQSSSNCNDSSSFAMPSASKTEIDAKL